MCESVMSQQVVVVGASLRAGANTATSAVATEKEVKSERKRVVTVMDEFDGNYDEKDERKAAQHVTSTECDATAVATKACAPQRCYSNTSSNSNSSTTTTTTTMMSSGSTSSSTCRTSEWIETGSCVESAGHTTTCCPLSATPHAPLPVRFIASTNMSSVGGATQSSRTEGPQTPRSNSSSLEQEDEEHEEEEGNEVRSRHVRSESDTTPSALSRCSTREETTNASRTTAQSLSCGTRCVPHVNTIEAGQDDIVGRAATIITAQGLPGHGPLMQPQRRSSLHTGPMLMCNLHYVVCDDEAYRPVMGKDAQEEKEGSSSNTEKANGQRSEKSGANNNNKDSEEHRHHGACLRHHTTTTTASMCDKCSRSPGTSKESRRGSLTSTKTHYAFSSLAASREGKTHRLMLLSEPSSEALPPPPPPPPPQTQTQQIQQPSHVSTRTEVTKMTNVIIAPAETSSPQEGNNNSNTSSATGTDTSRQLFVMRADPATMKELHQGKVPRMPGYSMVDWAARLARERARGMPARRQLTVDEVAQHNTLNDIWIVVDDVVYDITEFQHYHPGGEALFRRCAGRDATELFYACHAWISCSSMLRPFAVGVLKR